MILDDIIFHKKIQVEAEKKAFGGDFTYVDKIEIRDFKGAIDGEKISIIGEIKKASPSKGIIIEDFKVENIAGIYEELEEMLFS